eukprot:6253174-Heterocapsa_arctica.AAC.1
MKVSASGHMMIDITEFDDDALLVILDFPNCLLLPDATGEAAEERLRMAGEMEFARALFAMNPCRMRNPGDLRAWE